MQKVLFAIVMVFALTVGGVGAYAVATKQRPQSSLPVNAKLGGNFILPSTLGRPLNLKDLRGKVVLLNFGFTSCPDVCPTVLARLRQTLKDMGPEADQVQVVFASFDPARDTLAHMKPYLAYFDPGIIGVTGSEAEVAAVAKQYGVVYIREELDSAVGYGFAHSDYIYLIDPAGRVRKLYDSRAGSEEMQADARALLNENKSWWSAKT